MAAYVDCDNANISLEELLNSLLVKNEATGDYGLRTVSQTTTCVNITDGITCDTPLKSVADILRHIVVIDGCGKPAINLVSEA